MEKENKFPTIPLINPHCLSPFTLYQQVPTLQTQNMTQIETVLGLINQINGLITLYNQIASELNQIGDLPGQMKDLEDSLNLLAQQMAEKLLQLGNAIAVGDRNTLTLAKAYTDEQIANLADHDGGGIRYGALTADEYDYLGLQAVDYDDLGMTAKEYDTRAKYILLGEDGTIWLQFKNNVQVIANQPVFEIPAGLPIKPGKRYQVEISLGNFSLNSGTPVHLEITGVNTLGTTMPITVPNGGSSTVAVIWTQAPTGVRAMSDQETTTAYNAYIKIKPLGEL